VIPSRRVEVTRTYLEMRSPADLAAADTDERDIRLERLAWCPASFYRYLYAEVGGAYRWRDRVNWSDRQLREHLERPQVHIWLLTKSGAPAGYFELERHDSDDSVEIAYFGLLAEAIGRGLGRWLLTEAVRRAWTLGPERVWVHTCTLDHPAALPNYLARGFRVVREERYAAEE
jgi:GNAT superfamily N-acetyltransferase